MAYYRRRSITVRMVVVGFLSCVIFVISRTEKEMKNMRDIQCVPHQADFSLQMRESINKTEMFIINRFIQKNNNQQNIAIKCKKRGSIPIYFNL